MIRTSGSQPANNPDKGRATNNLRRHIATPNDPASGKPTRRPFFFNRSRQNNRGASNGSRPSDTASATGEKSTGRHFYSYDPNRNNRGAVVQNNPLGHGLRPKSSGQNRFSRPLSATPTTKINNLPDGDHNRPAGKRSARPPRRMPRKLFDIENPLPGSNTDENGNEQVVNKKIPPLGAGNIRIVPLGGVEEIGKNMTVVEFGNDIIVVDAGFSFARDEDAPGIDYILPDTTYLEERKSKIRGVLITHGHLDHIGGIPYLMEKIGNPPIYTSLLTAVMIKKRQEEFPHLQKLNLQTVEPHESLRLGQLKVRFFQTTHTIPDSLGVIIETPYGNIIFTGDIKVEHKGGIPVKSEVELYGNLGKEKNLVLLGDSTNVERQGFSFPEEMVQENLREIIRDIPGRIIIGTFASLLERIIQIIMACEAMGKKVAIEGRSMKNNVEIAKELGLLKAKRDTIISTSDIDNYPDNQIVIMATGAQGDEFAALMRLAKKEHKLIKIHKGDTVLLSSSVIPGNERSVQKLKDNLSRQGAAIIHYGIADVHSSGHSYAGEVAWMYQMLKPQFAIPVHGHHFMLRVHANIALKNGVPEKNIAVPDNGSVIEITDQGRKIGILKETASRRLVMVDGLGAGDVKEVVIRDRQVLAQDGMFVLIAIIDISTGKVRKSPDIISRGFVYLKESQDLLQHVRALTKKTIENSTAQMHPINFDYVKNNVREELGKYLFQKTAKRPIILPVLIEV